MKYVKKNTKTPLTKDLLVREKTVNKLTVKEISKKYGWSEPTIARRLKEFGIRYPRKDVTKRLSKEEFYDMYYVQDLSIKEILKKYDCTYTGTLAKKRKEWGFPIRTDKHKSNNRVRAIEAIRKHPFLYGSVLSSIKTGAKTRGLEVKITLEDIWRKFQDQNMKCALTGEILSFPRTSDDLDNHREKHRASVDRINSALGYTFDNIQIIDKDINLMKSYHSQEKFIEICHKVSNFNKDKNTWS